MSKRMKLERAAEPLSVEVDLDPVTAAVMKDFDLVDLRVIREKTDFYPWVVDGVLPEDWGIGAVVGASGTGKSTLLKDLGLGRRGRASRHVWDRHTGIAGHFATADEAQAKLSAVGLGDVPTWAKPYHVLSTGEKFRADLARSLQDGALIDEYTSTVSRVVAQSASRGLRSWVRRTGARRIVVASCHHDVLDWLRPDWVISTDDGVFYQRRDEGAERWWLEWTEPEPTGRVSWT